MFANTKQVRKVGNAIAGFGAQWTEKTSDYNENRRSVCWMLWGIGAANAMAVKLREEFARLGYTNRVAVTQGIYVRVIADLG